MESKEFIGLVSPAAQELQKKFGIFSSVTIAQAILETGWGKSLPIDKITKQNSFNLFGVKGKGPAGSVSCLTEEVYNGKRVTITAQFRAYNSYLESLEDHHKLLMSDRYLRVRKAETPEIACKALYDCGYATDPKYANSLISLINQYGLKQYDIIEPKPVPGPFPDVPEGLWYSGHVTRCKNAGLLKGDDKGNFNPDKPVTHIEMAVILARLMDLGVIKG